MFSCKPVMVQKAGLVDEFKQKLSMGKEEKKKEEIKPKGGKVEEEKKKEVKTQNQ
jgi:hypothetical protein